jgi:hypothetical protein
MKKLLITTICAAGLATGASAATATFDFVALAAGNEGGIEGMSYTDNGLTVTVTSSHNAYLDDLNSAGRPAGLGVCKVLNGNNECTPSNDDNLAAGESVTLTFSNILTGGSNVALTMFDAAHNSLAGAAGSYGLASNNAPTIDLDFDAGGVPDFSVFAGEFSYTFSYVDTAYYLGAITVDFDPNQAAPIPLPAGLPLLAGALGMLALGRRRKAA